MLATGVRRRGAIVQDQAGGRERASSLGFLHTSPSSQIPSTTERVTPQFGEMQSILIDTFAPFPSLSLSLPASTPVSSLSYILSPLCPPSLQSLSTFANAPVSSSSSAPLSSLNGSHVAPLHLRLAVRLVGGKGGFASQLRAQGGRMSSNKATNNDSCRDLNGRRLSTIKEATKCVV